MRRRGALVAALLSSALFGCAGSFTSVTPTSYRAPAEALVASLRDKSAPPIAQDEMPTDALRDVHAVGGSVLLDFATDVVAELTVRSGCGPLELRGQDGRRVWRLEREASCEDALLAVEPHLVLLGRRAPRPGGALTPRLFTLDPASGAVLAQLDLAGVESATMSGADVVVSQAQAGKRRLTLFAGANLAKKWEAPIDDARGVIVTTVTDTLLAFGGSITAVDRATGKVIRSTSLGAGMMASRPRIGAGGAYSMVVPTARKADAKSSLVRVNPDGAIAWTLPTAGVLDGLLPDAVVLVDGKTVTAARSKDGSVAWTASLPGRATGPGLSAKSGHGNLYLVPHEQGVTAIDADKGTLAFTVAPLGPSTAVDSDHLSQAADGLVILDTARGLAGLDLATAGASRWSLPVRSLVHVTREGRVEAASADQRHADGAERFAASARRRSESVNESVAAQNRRAAAGYDVAAGQLDAMAQAQAAVGAYQAARWELFLSSLVGRRNQHLEVSNQQARIDDESPFIMRPLSWSTGRGVLVVRKRDGAFRELVIGPPDVYEGPFRAASVGAVVGSGVFAFAEGLDASKWHDRKEAAGLVRLVRRSLLVYALDETSLLPAAEYEKRSIVPLGSF